jgi:hypothetical protein
MGLFRPVAGQLYFTFYAVQVISHIAGLTTTVCVVLSAAGIWVLFVFLFFSSQNKHPSLLFTFHPLASQA